MRRALVCTGVCLALVAPACGGSGGSDDGRPRIVATTSILGDVTSEVVGDQATVEVLLPPGTDAHAFEPAPSDVASLQEADLVVAIGLDLEEGLHDALGQASDSGTEVLEIAPAVDPIPFTANADESGPDPHIWFDPERMQRAVDLIAEEVAGLDGVDAAVVRASAEDYAGRLQAMDREVEELLSGVRPERRLLVTNHDALGYFSERYDFEIVGTVIPGGTTLAEPSANELAQLAQTVEELDVPAVFAETSSPDDLARALADEVGGEIQVVELYTESLGPDGSAADTYLGMIRTDAERIVDALTA